MTLMVVGYGRRYSELINGGGSYTQCTCRFLLDTHTKQRLDENEEDRETVEAEKPCQCPLDEPTTDRPLPSAAAFRSFQELLSSPSNRSG